MEDSQKMTFYRIGEYARKMGVTPDFLKHYEQQGILRSHPQENGYRYFSFSQSSKILECMRLKNYGFSLREIEELFAGDLAAAQKKTELQVRQLEEKVRFEQRVIAEYRQLSQWLARLEGKADDWRIDWGDEMLFLPHTDGRRFLEDPEIYEILKDWISRMPMVKSAMEIPRSQLGKPFRPDDSRFCWGMVVKKSDAEEMGLPVNGAVKSLPRRKLFRFFFNDTREPDGTGIPLDAAWEKMRELNLSPAGNAYMTAYMCAGIQERPQRCGTISIPIL